ncbi:MAG: hypothetical protein AB7K37_02705 [Cyclobacteriaceae bacterium]
MKVLFLAVFLFTSLSAFSQFRAKRNLFHTLANYFSPEKPSGEGAALIAIPPGTQAGLEIQQQFRSPMLLASAGGGRNGGDLYWMSSVTSQSYNQGKLGTYYYWDVQGNLRESHMFFDIAGKNKRGLKLVFPRR